MLPIGLSIGQRARISTRWAPARSKRSIKTGWPVPASAYLSEELKASLSWGLVVAARVVPSLSQIYRNTPLINIAEQLSHEAGFGVPTVLYSGSKDASTV